MVRSLLPVVLLSAPLLVAAPVPKELLRTAPKLDGKWKVVSYESNGRPVNSTVILSQTWAFRGEELSITRAPVGNGAAVPTATKIGIRADAKTKEFDYTFTGGTTRLGRYEIHGDTLTLCMTINTGVNAVRPATVDGGQGTLKYTFKRADKADDR